MKKIIPVLVFIGGNASMCIWPTREVFGLIAIIYMAMFLIFWHLYLEKDDQELKLPTIDRSIGGYQPIHDTTNPFPPGYKSEIENPKSDIKS
ncbi:MAG: hypothetical protein V4619_15465 [Bacteroidota bacterium]